jgi:hypothetical protein
VGITDGVRSSRTTRFERWASRPIVLSDPEFLKESPLMLLVGVDWAESEHAACLMGSAGGVLGRLKVPHTVAGLRRLIVAIAEREPQASAVLVAIERPDGLLVDGLLDVGYTLYALNPKAVERYRDRTSSAGAKTDPGDAELLATKKVAQATRPATRVDDVE